MFTMLDNSRKRYFFRKYGRVCERTDLDDETIQQIAEKKLLYGHGQSRRQECGLMRRRRNTVSEEIIDKIL